jgi:hypothetical protein
LEIVELIASAFVCTAASAQAQATNDVCIWGSPSGSETGLGVPYTATGFSIVSINAPISRLHAREPFGDRTFYDKTPSIGDRISIPSNIGGNLLVTVFTSDNACHGDAICLRALQNRCKNQSAGTTMTRWVFAPKTPASGV